MCILVPSIWQVCITVASGHDTFSNYYSRISHRVSHSSGRLCSCVNIRPVDRWRICSGYSLSFSVQRFGKQTNIFAQLWESLILTSHTIVNKWRWCMPTGNDFHCQSLLVSCFSSTVTHAPHELCLDKSHGQTCKLQPCTCNKTPMRKHPAF